MATQEKQTKAARNQALFRDVNERVRRASAQMEASETVRFLCECADAECVDTLQMTLVEYEGVRLVPTHFPVLPGHEWPDVERTIERHENYVVVEKFGEAGRLASQDCRAIKAPRATARSSGSGPW
jgi:hypothetical protein